MDQEQRIQALEETISHQDQQIADLSEMMILQGRELSNTQRLLKKLEDKFEAFEEEAASGEDAPQNATEFAARNKPPHY